MGYAVLPNINHGYGPRKGLEGPFQYANQRVLYYDSREGKYYDPRTDWYVEQEEMDLLHNMMLDLLKTNKCV